MRALALLALLPILAGCTDHTDLLATDGGADACPAPGPPIQLGTAAPCAGALAARRFRYALCSCSSLILTGDLVSDRAAGPRMPGPMMPAAAVGTDADLQAAGLVQVAGSLSAAGAGGARFSGTSVVFGDLRSGGPIAAGDLVTVGADAFAAGDVLGRVDIYGFLHAPDDVTIAPSVTASGWLVEPVQVAPPCACGDGPAFDIAALAAARALANDDARANLAPDAFAAGAGPAVLDLPCGEYFLTALDAPSELELRVHGRASLLVDGDVTLGAGLRVTADPSAELDLVIAGDLVLESGTLGAAPPTAARVWTGGSTVRLGAGANLSALVYAPSATLLAAGNLAVTGAVFAHTIAAAGDVTIHFDPDVLSSGVECGVAPEHPAM